MAAYTENPRNGTPIFLLGHRAAHLLRLVNVFDGIHLLHMCRLDLLEPERILAFTGKFRVAACVSEKLHKA
jgi:hypothetical protein